MNSTGQKVLWNTKLTANDSTAKETLGAYRYDEESGIGYRYIRYGSSVGAAGAAGTAVSFEDADGWVVTDDVTDGSVYKVAGVLLGTLTEDYYGWMQTRGENAAVGKKAAKEAIAEGDMIVLDETNDGDAKKYTFAAAGGSGAPSDAELINLAKTVANGCFGFASAAALQAAATMAVKLTID